MSLATWRSVRTVIRYSVYACYVLCVACVLVVIYPFLRSVASADQATELHDLSGRAAKSRMSNWPEKVSPQDVQRVSFKMDMSRDSNTSWYRIQLAPGAAAAWTSFIHEHQQNWIQDYHRSGQEGLESVNATVAGPPTMSHQTGDSPAWWTPPTMDFRATEFWKVPVDDEPGIARGTYSAFDQATSILWVCEYASQLW